MLPGRCLHVCPVCLSVTLAYCGQMVGWIKMKLGMQVGLGLGHIVLDWEPAELPSQFSARICYGQMAGWITMPLGREVGLSPSNIVLGGDPAGCCPFPKGAQLPIFGPYLLWPNGWMDQDATWQGRRPRPWPQCVRWGPSSPPKRGTPQFSAHVCRGQVAGWIKMPLGTKVGLGSGHIVLDWNPAPPLPKGTTPNFRPMSFVAKLSPI